jgi:hypothetical protein
MNIRGFAKYIVVFSSLLLLGGWGALSQSDGGRISYSVLKEDNDIVHVSQLELRVVSGSVSISSSVSVTRRTELRLDPGASLERTLFIGNETDQPQQFTAVLFIDDEQTTFSLGGRSSAAHTIEVPSNDQARQDLKITVPREEGLHNFVLVVFYTIELSSGASSESIFTPYADSLIVGEGNVPSQSAAHPGDDAFLRGTTVPSTMTLPPRGLTLSRNETPSSESALLDSASLSAGGTLNAFVHVRNGIPRQGNFDEFVLFALIDYEQISVDPSSDVPVAYFELPTNGLVSIPASFVAPDAPGDANLDLIAIRNPYGFLGATGGALEVLHHRVKLTLN